MRLRIKEFREEMQLTQRELAEKLNNVQRNVSNWENGASEPDCETILKLADFFGITVDELFGRDGVALGRETAVGVEYSILKLVRDLTEKQKAALLQFLKEMNG